MGEGTRRTPGDSWPDTTPMSCWHAGKRLLEQIDDLTVHVGGMASGQCPLHRDDSPPLAVAAAPDGVLTFKCLSRGCCASMIVSELKCRAAGKPRGQYGQEWDGRMLPVENLSYRTADGVIHGTDRLSLNQAERLAQLSGIPFGRSDFVLPPTTMAAEDVARWAVRAGFTVPGGDNRAAASLADGGKRYPILSQETRPDGSVVATVRVPAEDIGELGDDPIAPAGLASGWPPVPTGYFTSRPEGVAAVPDVIDLAKLVELHDELSKSKPVAPDPVLPGPISIPGAVNLSRYRMHRLSAEEHAKRKAAFELMTDGWGRQATADAGSLPDVKPVPIHFPDRIVTADVIVDPVMSAVRGKGDDVAEPVIVEARPQ